MKKIESTDQMQMRLTGNCVCSSSAYITVLVTHSFCPALPPQAQPTLPAWLTVSYLSYAIKPEADGAQYQPQIGSVKY